MTAADPPRSCMANCTRAEPVPLPLRGISFANAVVHMGCPSKTHERQSLTSEPGDSDVPNGNSRGEPPLLSPLTPTHPCCNPKMVPHLSVPSAPDLAKRPSPYSRSTATLPVKLTRSCPFHRREPVAKTTHSPRPLATSTPLQTWPRSAATPTLTALLDDAPNPHRTLLAVPRAPPMPIPTLDRRPCGSIRPRTGSSPRPDKRSMLPGPTTRDLRRIRMSALQTQAPPALTQDQEAGTGVSQRGSESPCPRGTATNSCPAVSPALFLCPCPWGTASEDAVHITIAEKHDLSTAFAPSSSHRYGPGKGLTDDVVPEAALPT